MTSMAKPRLEPLHRLTLGLWGVALVAFVLNFLAINQGGNWLQDLVAPLAIAFFVAGLLVIGIAAGVARFLFSGRYMRLGVLVGVPGLVVFGLVWLGWWA